MEYVYAAMLLHKAEKTFNEENITQVLTAAGINVDPIRVKALVASLTEVDIDEAIKAPEFMPTAPLSTPAPTPEEKPSEEKEKKEEEKEEVALEGLGALFG